MRSLEREADIVWETAPVPAGFAGDTATFVFMAAIDANESPRRFDLFVNEEPVLGFENPVTAELGTMRWAGRLGVRAEFRVTLIDKYGDAMGFIFLHVPRALWESETGRTLQLRVAGESAGAQTWFMVFKDVTEPRITLRNAPALLRGEDGNEQIVRVDVMSVTDGAARLTLKSAIGAIDTAVALGFTRFQLPVPAVESRTPTRLEVELSGARLDTTYHVQPVRPMELYLLHHTHVDIGYTHHQDDVRRIQWEHLENAIRYAEASADYPADARFVWNPESLWAVESYLENADPKSRERLITGMQTGSIEIDGQFGNLMTGLATDESLMRSMQTLRRIGRETGVDVRSEMTSDIPGFTWGLVPVLARHGIRYLSIGPNHSHRIGSFLDTWGDRPFYWESPSGKERLLTWISGGGYAWFHTGLGYQALTTRLDEDRVFQYLDQLAEQRYPYAIAHLRYAIGSDNGPPDPTLSDAVRDWNERYASPRLIISGTTRLFEEFESRHGAQLPVYRGDLTGYWEDGAASSSRETAMVRRAAESLAQTETLAAVLGRPLPGQELYDAWHNVTLYWEHTWGSWNSISEPHAEFTLTQWERKKSFADSAVVQARRLRETARLGRPVSKPTAGAGSRGSTAAAAFDVINTASWPRTDLVIVPAADLPDWWDGTGSQRVVDEQGEPALSQRLRNGDLAFRAADVPAFGSRRYRIEAAGQAAAAEEAATAIRMGDAAGAPWIDQGRMRVEVDPARGTIRSLKFRPTGTELVTPGEGLNDYVYVAGRSPEAAAHAGNATVEWVETGPLVFSIQTLAPAPGARGRIGREYLLYAGLDRIDVINRLDKELIYDPEAVLYRFPFAVDHPDVRVDVPFGSFQAEAEQLPGSSKNYMSVQRWVDVHNDSVGVTLVTIDAPMIQLREIATDAIVTGWRQTIQPDGTLFSYPMTNYWETNFLAAQEGLHEFRYSIRPHESYDEASSERFAREIAHPLIAVPVRGDDAGIEPPVRVEAERTVVTLLKRAEDGAGWFLRLYNAGSEPDMVRILGPGGAAARVYRSDAWEVQRGPVEGPLQLGAYEIVDLRIRR